MKKISLFTAFFSLMLLGCNSEPTLQKYFVESTESNDFIAVDLSTNILKLEQTKLSAEEDKALKTIEKMNILAFKADGTNQAKFESEKAKLQTILKDKKYQELMKVSSGKEGGAVYFVGEDNAIDEFVLYANKKEAGFAVVRVLGDNMDPASIMTMLSILKKSNIDLEQLKPLQAMVPQ
ncbi:DUF4252 domain-containing protein [Flavobacterium macacae]|jgi:hypothetical protein|uniref:DUF4252 domain-containing protein n=1 Tax=Flavobacterium macacae TaxID=2488993 RepID=A0A3P3WBQ9_9FLAO|nr:DUF4252 domain-containing protein [Flavobacterium macacae]RRJ92480.1 DUF4252 domain-containing protein [Flavobacterium macacae]